MKKKKNLVNITNNSVVEPEPEFLAGAGEKAPAPVPAPQISNNSFKI